MDLFPTITDAHWREAMLRARTERNPVREGIRAAEARLDGSHPRPAAQVIKRLKP